MEDLLFSGEMEDMSYFINQSIIEIEEAEDDAKSFLRRLEAVLYPILSRAYQKYDATIIMGGEIPLYACVTEDNVSFLIYDDGETGCISLDDASGNDLWCGIRLLYMYIGSPELKDAVAKVKGSARRGLEMIDEMKCLIDTIR